MFDAHSIIEYLIQNQSDVYLSTHQNGWSTEYYHSEISKRIASFEGININRVGESWSLNIHKKFTPNICWVKL
ncbi:hypothetical protein JXM83_06830 [Candidatus Woesearchaeota archaeon]|nr:hypothetical protein [Candidatus Woesearchaeota archaeon]